MTLDEIRDWSRELADQIAMMDPSPEAQQAIWDALADLAKVVREASN